jgi:hypothetical protein
MPTLAWMNSDQLGRFAERFWSHVDRRGPDDCWPWTAQISPDGYGRVQVGKTSASAHSVAYVLENGELETGKCVCHSCDVRRAVGDQTYRACCNPAHLWVGTRSDNNADRKAKGRCARGQRSGHCTHPERTPRGDLHWTRLHPERVRRGNSTWMHQHPEMVVRGERSGMAKLTDNAVRDIRTTYAAGRISQRALAARYGIDHSVVCDIVNRKLWAHVQDRADAERCGGRLL